MKRPLRVLVAEPPRAADRARFLQRHRKIEVVEVARTAQELEVSAQRLEPDALILDLEMEGVGVPLLGRLRDAGCVRPIVVVPSGDLSLGKALSAGGLGTVVSGSPEAILAALQVDRGDVLDDESRGLETPGRATGLHPLSPRRVALEHDLETLSGREKEVLRAVAYGYTNREIADHLGISIKSIETYRHRVSEKLSFSRRAELVRFAVDVGLIRAGVDGLP